MTNKLWKFYWDCGRMGSLDGLFVATQESVDAIVGQEIYFGEVLGKHSEIYGILEAKDLEEIDIGEDAINKLVAATGGGHSISGFSPFDYWERVDDDEYWAEQNAKEEVES